MPAAPADVGIDYAARFHALDAWLCEHQALWRAKPFTTPTLPWESDWPELSRWLRSRTLEQADAAHNQPHLLEAPAPFTELARQAHELTRLPIWYGATLGATPERLSRHIPGRKWQQIQQFANCTLQHWQGSTHHWLDWCAGKGHLGRLLAWQSGQPLTCLEQNAELNRQGAELGQLLGITSQHLDADVLNPASWSLLHAEHSVVALHACGQLHMTLLQQAAAQHCSQLAISPCCYNRINSDAYQPLSQRARNSALRLTRTDLGLPLQESVTASQRVRSLRDRSMAWRLAFDLWQRQARTVDSYLPTPSRPESALHGDIATFCRDLAAYHGLQLKEPDDWQQLEQQGWQRLAAVRNLELVSGTGRTINRVTEVYLCRCGHSRNKPYCDGSHVKAGFKS